MKRLKIGLLSAMRGCAGYPKLTKEEQDALRAKRLSDIIAWARENSPFYRELYAGLPENPQLCELPPVSKAQLMARWDDWVTDRSLKLSDVIDFMHDMDNIGRKLHGKYMVLTTSGSTGEPLVAVCDAATDNVNGAVNAVRAFARKKDLRAFIKRGGKTIGVFATGGFYLGNSSVRAKQRSMPWKKRQIAVTSALKPIAEIVSELNSFKPAMLGGYPSSLELLIEEKKSGRLNISPVLIMTGGERLTQTLRDRLAEAFCCYVQSSYSCTEGGTLACECENKRYHINDDWVILEPVDICGNPVPNGTRADKLLLTNLFNYTQPYIRYEITDRATLHDEPCGCGNTSPWVSIEGRTDDMIRFTENGAEIKLAPLAVYATLKEVHELRRFQLIAHPDNRAELRFDIVTGADRGGAFEKAKEALLAFFASQGLSGVTVELYDDAPCQDAGSGKFKHIIQAK